jgi:hypothetical protein
MAKRKMGANVDRGVSRQGQLIWAHARPVPRDHRRAALANLVLHLARNLVAKRIKQDKLMHFKGAFVVETKFVS